VYRPAFLVEHQVAAAQRARSNGPVIAGASGNAPEYPRGARVLRGLGRDRLSEPAHQCVGVELGVAASLTPGLLPVVPPTTLVLSGVNRTS
jgi:hypothetical protein